MIEGDVNLYRFVGNDPVNNVDPMELYVESDQFILDHMPTNADYSMLSDMVSSLWGGSANWVLVKRYLVKVGGQTSLKELGILGQFLNTPSIKTAIEEIREEARNNNICEGGTWGDGYMRRKEGIDLTWDIFVLGGTSISYQYVCKGNSCSIDYKVDDPFVDPYDLWELLGKKFDGGENKWREPSSPQIPIGNRWNSLWNLGGVPYQIVDMWSERIDK